MSLIVRPLGPADDLTGWFVANWGGDTMVAHGRVFRPVELSGLVAERKGHVGGVVTWVVEGDTMEIVSLDASRRREGIGSRLVAGAIEAARDLGLRRVALTTTNDNCTAMVFWQTMGFRFVALRPDAVTQNRHLKSTIPEAGDNGVPIRDELDLELLLG